MNLHDYDLVIINSSGGKDSIASIWKMCKMADVQGYPRARMHISHQCLGESEWPGTLELVHEQAKLFGLPVHVTKQRDKAGKEQTLLEYALMRGKWPSGEQRWCTSEFKRGPGARVITKLTKGYEKCNVLYVFGFRKDESPAREKKKKLVINKRWSTKTRTVTDYLPIHDWNCDHVWSLIKEYDLPYHYAYDLRMPRLSCVFCIYTTFDALVIAGRSNPALLDKYVDAEDKMGHRFNAKFSLREVKEAIESGYEPTRISDWVM